MCRARPQALGPPGQARPGLSRAEPDAGPERAQGSGLRISSPSRALKHGLEKAHSSKFSTPESENGNYVFARFKSAKVRPSRALNIARTVYLADSEAALTQGIHAFSASSKWL
ncbi:hypothetical protein FB451DRAFT_1177623 [Mycena latifolia]|nr:hypothetical protein FB451DRAFT_1177623 [Mycena latifolia]